MRFGVDPAGVQAPSSSGSIGESGVHHLGSDR